MTEEISGLNQQRFGWCPMEDKFVKTPVLSENKSAGRITVSSGGSAKKAAEIKSGFLIAKESIRTLLKNKKLLWFSLTAALVILAMFILEIYLMNYAHGYSYASLGYTEELFLTFSIQLISVLSLNLLLGGLLINLSQKEKTGCTGEKKIFSDLKKHIRKIFLWSVLLALAGTVIHGVLTNSPSYSHIYPALGSVLYIPFVYYIPPVVLSAQTHIFIKIFISTVLFLATLFVVPAIVTDRKDLFNAALSSFSTIKRTGIEILGCFLIFGALILLISLPQTLISASPAIVGYDYHFFSVYSTEMAAVCIVYLIVWWASLASVFTLCGIAVHKLNEYAKTGIPK
ncbi:MAG: hypothetical protein PHO78_08375 [Methanomicrobium sp.]|nr:hypothetical protein [Methanomicrobium sp.]